MSGVLAFLADGEDVFVGDDERFFAAPASIDGLAELYQRHPDATHRRRRHRCRPVDHQAAARPAEDHPCRPGARTSTASTTTADELIIGAGATYAAGRAAISPASIPISASCCAGSARKQVRASGTIGGNIANGSPIGDTPPMLIALGATLTLRQGKRRCARCRWRISSSPTASRTASRGELVTAHHACRSLNASDIFRCYKVTKRFDQDISVGDGRLPLHRRR